MKLERLNLGLGALFVLIVFVALAGCAPAVAPTTAPTPEPVATVVPPTSAPAATPTGAPAAAAPQAKAVTLQIVQNDKLGKFLADADGRTFYLFTKDSPGTSVCYDKCAQSWPAVLPDGKPTLKDGAADALIGTTQRKDGTMQLTYNGWPVYYYAPDAKPGDTNGEGVGKVWWVISGEGNAIKPAGIQVSQNDKLGKFLAADAGRTVYVFTKDSKDTTVCYDKCEQAWPPLLTMSKPTLASGVTASMVGSIQRKDGSMQVTYNGMPLYYYSKDKAPGDTTGQGVGTVWFVLGPDGNLVKQAAQ